MHTYLYMYIHMRASQERRKTLIKDSMLSNQKIFVNQLIISGISTIETKVLYNNSNLNKRPKIFTKIPTNFKYLANDFVCHFM